MMMSMPGAQRKCGHAVSPTLTLRDLQYITPTAVGREAVDEPLSFEFPTCYINTVVLRDFSFSGRTPRSRHMRHSPVSFVFLPLAKTRHIHLNTSIIFCAKVKFPVAHTTSN